MSIWHEFRVSVLAYLFQLKLESESEKAPMCYLQGDRRRCYATNSRASYQAGTCLMLSLVIWLGKPFTQARIQGQEKNASLAPEGTNQRGRQPQSSVGPGLSSLELWLPSGLAPAPNLDAPTSNINFLELRTPLPQPAGDMEAKSSPGIGSTRFHRPRAAPLQLAVPSCSSEPGGRLEGGVDTRPCTYSLSPFLKGGKNELWGTIHLSTNGIY